MPFQRSIRPAAIVPEEAARAILAELRGRSVERDGCWVATAQRWSRYDGPGVDSNGEPQGQLIGVIEAVYGASTRYEVTLYRVTVDAGRHSAGWTIESLCDEPLALRRADARFLPAGEDAAAAQALPRT